MDDLSKMTARARHHVTEDGRLAGGSSGGGGVIYIAPPAESEQLTSYETMAYADESLTTPLMYEQGAAIVKSPHILVMAYGGDFASITPTMSIVFPTDRMIQCVSGDAGMGIHLTFSDTPVD